MLNERMTHLGSEVGHSFSVVDGHVNALLIPGRFVVWIAAKAHPHILGMFGSFLFSKCLLNNNVAILHEEVDLLSYAHNQYQLPMT